MIVGTIGYGTVKDQTGAVIAGAEVTVINRATRDDQKAITDSTGNYAIALLPPGDYRVSITANGFKRATFDNETVVITETTFVNADLAVGALSDESVTNSTSNNPRLIQFALKFNY